MIPENKVAESRLSDLCRQKKDIFASKSRDAFRPRYDMGLVDVESLWCFINEIKYVLWSKE